MELINNIPMVEKSKFKDLFEDAQSAEVEMGGHLTELRFSARRVCPICNRTHVRWNGRRKNGSQKFVCMDCARTSPSGRTPYSTALGKAWRYGWYT